ncbi:MAG TPA: hypothetical protein ENJ09_07240 [Planctomycetes bacterium]|nr:hypothetical protein [Planctomycetota bacterium]
MESIPPRSPAPSRRTFLHQTAKAAAFLATAPTLGTVVRASGRGQTTWTLEAVEVQESFADGSTVPFFRFLPLAGTPVRGRLPLLEATEGTMVTLTIVNRLQIPIRPGVVGVGAGPRIAPGATVSLSFRMLPAGSYVFREAAYSQISGVLGLAAALVSRPSSGLNELWNGGPTFDREYILHYQDSDQRWNDAAAMLTFPNLSVYEPNFFTVNGLSYPDTSADPDTLIGCQMGERVLLRLSNAGHMRQAIHFHGYHVDIAARNNVANTMLPPKDTVEVASGSTTDVILTVNQTGLYPVHPHSLTAVTANGLYPYGQLTLISAT